MSYSLKYYPDPGIAFDISKMLFVKLNPETVWKECLTTLDSPIDEVQFIYDHAASFPSPDPLLLLFSFKLKNETGTFLSQTISNLSNNNFPLFSIKQLLTYLNNIPVVQKDISWDVTLVYHESMEKVKTVKCFLDFLKDKLSDEGR